MTPPLTLAQAHARWKEAKQALPECIDDCFGNQSGEHDSLCPRAGLNVALLSLRLHEAEAALLSLSSAPQEPPQTGVMMDKWSVGLYHKFNVTRTDGTSAPGGKHDGCDYFVLDLTHDVHALPALMAYVASCRAEFPLLAADLDKKIALLGAEYDVPDGI